MVKKTKVKVAKAKKTVDEKDLLKSQLARALADYDNLRKRAEKDKLELERRAGLRVMLRVLQVMDMLFEVQKHLKDSGLSVVIGEFKKILSEEGIVEIDVAVGDKFDENLHEAVEVVEDKVKKKGEIVEVVQIGWMIENGPVVRPAKVKAVRIK